MAEVLLICRFVARTGMESAMNMNGTGASIWRMFHMSSVVD
jgi:hypothetical protein